jgi:hypothetical protein
MKTYEFAIIATGLDPHESGYEDRFFAVGCDDATFSFQRGLIIAEFAREAPTLSRALLTAIDAIRSAGASVERIEPDYLVSLSEIAERCQLSKQAISLYAKGERRSGFPPPTAKVMSGHPLWDWCAVASWLHEKSLIDLEAAITARIMKEVNTSISATHIPHDELARRLEALDCPGMMLPLPNFSCSTG